MLDPGLDPVLVAHGRVRAAFCRRWGVTFGRILASAQGRVHSSGCHDLNRAAGATVLGKLESRHYPSERIWTWVQPVCCVAFALVVGFPGRGRSHMQQWRHPGLSCWETREYRFQGAGGWRKNQAPPSRSSSGHNPPAPSPRSRSFSQALVWVGFVCGTRGCSALLEIVKPRGGRKCRPRSATPFCPAFYAALRSMT